ncbi:MAG: hypothetical protein KC910_11830, partial [Candidatus Eremiobacteraeota bacterium]|nr:hypothetical protein [Candidatus Eremiobacteraeota bacterium]
MQIRPYGQVGSVQPRRLAQPARAAGGPADTVALGGGQLRHAPVPVATAAAAAVGGPVGPTLAERLKELPVEYHLKKWLRLPFCAPTKVINPHHAAYALETFPDQLMVKEGDHDPVPLNNLQDVNELEVFYGKQEPFDDLSKLLSDPELKPYAWQDELTRYQAYNLAREGWPAAKVGPEQVTLLRHGLPVANLEAKGLVRTIAEAASNIAKIDSLTTAEQRLSYVAEFSNDDTVAGRLEQAGLGKWSEALQGLAKNCDLKTAAGVMCDIGLSDPELASKLKVVTPAVKHRPAIQTLLQFYAKARQAGASAEQASGALARLGELAAGRNKDALGYAEGLTSDIDSLALYNRCLEHLEPTAAAHLHGALGNSKLKPADHLRLLERTPVFRSDYGQPLSTQPEAATMFARGVTGVLEAGRSADEAVDVANRLWAGVSQLTRPRDYIEPAWQEAAKAAADPDALELYLSLVEAKFHPDAAAHLQGVMSATGAGPADFKTMQALDLIDGSSPLTYYKVKEKAWTAFARAKRPEALQELQRLGKRLVASRVGSEPAQAAFDYYANNLSAGGSKFEDYMALLDGGFAPTEAQRVQQLCPKGDLSRLAGLGATSATPEVVDAFLAALEKHPDNKDLKSLVQATVSVKLSSEDLLALAGHFEKTGQEPTLTRGLARLVGHRLPPNQAIALLEQVQAQAGVDRLEEHLNLLEKAGAFQQSYDSARYHQPEAPRYLYTALAGLLEAGLSGQEATSKVVDCCQTLASQRKWNHLATACSDLAALASDRQQLSTYQALMSQSFDAPNARRVTGQLAQPLQGTDFAQRWQDYQALKLDSGSKPLSYYVVKDACLAAYSSALEAGQSRTQTLAQLQELGQVLDGRESGEGKQAFQFYPRLLEHPGHFDAYVSLLKSGFPVERAVQAVGSSLDCKAASLAKVLSGLGAKGQKLTPELVESFLAAFRATGQSEALAPLAEATTRQNLDQKSLAPILEVYTQRLHREPAPLAALVALVERRQAKAVDFLGELEKSVPADALMSRIDQLDKLQAFSQGYGAAGNFASPSDFNRCLDGLAGAGLGIKAQLSTCLAAWKSLDSHGRREGLPQALAHVAEIAGQPERLEAYQLLLDQSYHADSAARIESLIAEPTAGLSLSDRRAAYEKMGLLESQSPLTFYSAKMAAYRAWRSVAQTRDPDTARTQMTRLLEVLPKRFGNGQEALKSAQLAIEKGEKFLLDSDQKFGAYCQLLEAGHGLSSCERILERMVSVTPATTAEVLAPLATAADEVLEAVQQCAEETASAGRDPSTLAPLAKGLVKHRSDPAITEKALQLYTSRLSGQPELAEVAGRMLQHGLRPEVVGATLTLFESAPAKASDQLQLIEASGLFRNDVVNSGESNKLIIPLTKKLVALLQSGQSTSKAGTRLKSLLDKVARYKNDEQAPALDYLAKSEHPEMFFQFRELGFHVAPAGQFADLLAKPVEGTTVDQRLVALLEMTGKQELGRFYAVKSGAYRLYSKLISEGGSPEQMPAMVGGLITRMGKTKPEKAARILDTLAALPNPAG